MKMIRKIVASIMSILCVVTILIPAVYGSADMQEATAPAPIQSFVLKNASPQNVIFKRNNSFQLVVYDANGAVVEPVEYGKYDENQTWHKEENIPKKLIPQYLSKVNYTYTIKQKKGKGDYGTYEVKVKASEEYGGETLCKTVKVLPNEEDVRMSFFFYRDSSYRIKGVSDSYHVEAIYNKITSKYLDGVQYVYAKDKKYKKIYKKGTLKLTTPKTIKCSKDDSGVKGKIGPTISKIKYGKCYVKWRVYKTVNGKKVYSKWKKQHMWMNGYVLDE